MARNTKAVGKKRAAKKRTQQPNPQTGLYVKRDAATGKFISDNENGSPYQGATKEEIAKMSPVLKKLADYDKKGKQSAD